MSRKPNRPPAQELQRFLEGLYRRAAHGIKLGLDVETGLLRELGDAQNDLVFLHVAGTNGKGSVCAMLDSVLRDAGVRVGLYTSPHLVKFNERIRVDGACITDEDLAELTRVVDEADRRQAAQSGREATFFEFTTALAMDYFRRRNAQVVVLETGLGGRLDATNVVTPMISLITRIGMEHTAYLGDTLGAIAGEKGGIIKPGVPVICGAMPEEARDVIQRMARERGAPLVFAEEACSVQRLRHDLDGQKIRLETANNTYAPVRLPLPGAHQLENVALSVAALEQLAQIRGVPIVPESIQQGLESVHWPGRLQVWQREPLVLLDVAHNPDAAKALAVELKDLLKKRPMGLVFALLSDKDLAGFLRPLAPLAQRGWAVPLRTERALPVEKLVAGAQAAGLPAVPADLPDAMKAAREWAAGEKGVLCVCGSLFLAGELMELEGFDPAKGGTEP